MGAVLKATATELPGHHKGHDPRCGRGQIHLGGYGGGAVK